MGSCICTCVYACDTHADICQVCVRACFRACMRTCTYMRYKFCIISCCPAAGGMISRQVEEDVQDLVQQALSVAKSVVKANMTLHGAMSRKLESTERLDGRSLQDWLASVTVPEDLRDFVQKGQNRVKKGTGARKS